MLSLTSQYALRALIHLAVHVDQWPIPGNQIAEGAEIPAKYLSKVLGDLVRVGVLTSSRGIGGGFRMLHPPKETRLIDVLAPFEQFERRRCPFGNKECGDHEPCLAHDRWKKVIEAEQGFLRRTSVYDVAFPQTKRVARRSKKR
jgi:Rrf2 family protein